MFCAHAGDTAGHDLAAFGHEVAQALRIFVVDRLGVVRAERATTTPTTSATYVFSVDTSNMVNGDLTELRCYDMVDGTNYRQMWKATYQHVQINNAKASPPLAVTTQAKFTLKQTAGTGRAFPWSDPSVSGRGSLAR